MVEYRFKQVDFDNPSLLFVIEDLLKNAIGEPLLYDSYFKTFQLKGNEKVLDFGCGGGAGSRSLLRFLSRDGHLTCVDSSNYWIRKAERRLKKYPNAVCKAGDITRLDIPDESFDVISVFHVLHDIVPGNRQATVNALSTKLKQRGMLYVREPTKQSHGISIAELCSLASRAGFKEIGHTITKSEYLGKFQKD